MYVGHLAVGLAAVKARPRVPLWLLLIAAQAPDWIELAFGGSRSYDPGELRSHSLPVVAALATGFALMYLVFTGDWRGGGLLIVVTLSHSVLDLVTGSKVLWPGTRPVGACLYNQPGFDFLIEAAIAVAGWGVYRTALGRHRSSRVAWAALLALLASQSLLDVAQEARLRRAPYLRADCVDAARS